MTRVKERQRRGPSVRGILGLRWMGPLLIMIVSPEIDEDDSDEEVYVKPAKKKKEAVNQVEPATKKGAPVSRKISQSMKPASPPKPKPKKVGQKKWGGSSEDDEDGDLMDYDDLPKPPARSAIPARAARGARKKYVEILTEDEE
jgi:DNA topoisomerase II